MKTILNIKYYTITDLSKKLKLSYRKTYRDIMKYEAEGKIKVWRLGTALLIVESDLDHVLDFFVPK